MKEIYPSKDTKNELNKDSNNIIREESCLDSPEFESSSSDESNGLAEGFATAEQTLMELLNYPLDTAEMIEPHGSSLKQQKFTSPISFPFFNWEKKRDFTPTDHGKKIISAYKESQDHREVTSCSSVRQRKWTSPISFPFWTWKRHLNSNQSGDNNKQVASLDSTHRGEKNSM